MLGAIIGDIVGSRFEFDNIKTKEFELFDIGCDFTDDTVMTVAVAEAMMDLRQEGIIKLAKESDTLVDEVHYALVDSLKKWGRTYPAAGYGGRFNIWLKLYDREPYNSFGNGSAMRCSACGWIAKDLEEAILLGRWSAEVTHNHPEGVKGAEAVSAAIFMSRTGSSKEQIAEFIADRFGYDLDLSCDGLRPFYKFDETCQGTVPEAIVCFLEADSYEDAIRNAISIGGDSDTIGAITGGIAEAYFGIPKELKLAAVEYLDKEMIEVINRFYERYGKIK